jgi:hypothetical protein
MLDKLFVRVRSWLHIDPAATSTVPAASLAGVPGPAISDAALGAPKRADRDASPTPPPLPAEAFSLVMEAQPESGMVITESGIIIIDPNATDAGDAAKAAASPSDAWALPNAPVQPVPSRSESYGDWDTVLARARAQLNTPDKSKAEKSKPGK